MSCCDYTTELNTKLVIPSRNENIHVLIQNLKDETDEFTCTEEKEGMPTELERYQNCFYCWITPTNFTVEDLENQDEPSQSQLLDNQIVSSIVNPLQFIFQFYLWICYKDEDDNDIHYKYKFQFGWKQLNDFYTKKKHQLCFADKSWPKWFIDKEKTMNQISEILDKKLNNVNENDLWYVQQQETAENENIQTKDYIVRNTKHEIDTMNEICKYMTYDNNDIGRGPGSESNWTLNSPKRMANEQDASVAAHVLCKIFNCPKLVLTVDFFSYFDVFEDEMKKTLQILAQNSLQHLRYIGYNWHDPNDVHYVSNMKLIEENAFWRHKNAHRKLYNVYQHKITEFHHVYVMKKEMKSFHWALKFVGINKLLTIEYFNNSRVRVQLLENNVIGQKIFWYGNAGDFEKCTFTKRWNVITKLRLDPIITGGQIGHWIDLWFIEYKKYHPLTNSCQHFARDIMSAIDCNSGKILIHKMQRLKVSRSIWPSNIKTEEEKRTIEMSKKLKLWGLLQKLKLANNNDVVKLFNDFKKFDIEELRCFDENGLRTERTIQITEEQIRIYLECKDLLKDPE